MLYRGSTLIEGGLRRKLSKAFLFILPFIINASPLNLILRTEVTKKGEEQQE